MTEIQEPVSNNPWFDGSVAAAVESANAKGSVLLVCLVQETTEGSESDLFERRFSDNEASSELSRLNLVALRLVKDSADGLMFGQIFPVMVVPALYLIRNGLLTDFMNNAVGQAEMLERIRKAVDGHFQIPPPPTTTSPATAVASTSDTSDVSFAVATTPSSVSTSEAQQLSTETSPLSMPINTPAVVPSAHPSSSTNDAPRSDQAQELRELMKERKLKREKEEREAEKQREKDRRSSSKALAEAQRGLSDKQTVKMRDQIEKEKREEADYKKRVKQALEEDKARRRAEKERAQAAAAANAAQSSPLQEHTLTPGEIRAQNAGLRDARNDAGPALAYDSSRLNIRLFDGSSIRNSFKATDTLEQVRVWINQNQQASEDTYNIVQLIPSRTFTDESKMLRDLELCPSATLVLKKTATASTAYGTSEDGAVPTLLGYGWSALNLAGKVASSAYSTVSNYIPMAGSSSSGSNINDRANRPDRTSDAASSKKKDPEVSYNGNSTNLE